MARYKVTRPFRDEEDRTRHVPGEFITTNKERGDRLVAARVVVEAGEPAIETATRSAPENAARRTTAPEPRHVGGGWYDVNGERVQGKDAAIKKMQE